MSITSNNQIIKSKSYQNYDTFEQSDNMNDIENSNNVDIKPLCRSDYLLIMTYAYISVIISFGESNLAPFFPKEAERKGLKPSVYGFLISIQEIVTFAVCPIIGLMIPRAGVRSIMLVGSMIASIGNIIFGLCDKAAPGLDFILSCAMVRTFGALGIAGMYGCTYGSIPILFPNHVSQVFGLCEMCTSIGFVFGPFVGGLLYEYVGFGPTFYLSGILMSVSFPLTYFFNVELKDSWPKTVYKYGIIDILSNFRIFVNICVTFTVAIDFGFMQVSFEPHLRSIAVLKDSTVGEIFLVFGIFYGITTCLIGLKLSKIENVNIINAIGLTCIIISYVFIGPMYPITITPSIPLVIACQIIIGIGFACCLVGSYTEAMREQKFTEFQNDNGATSLLGSLLMSTYSLGVGIGPSLGGVLIEKFSYAKSCAFIVGLTSGTVSLVLFTIFLHRRPAVALNPTTSSRGTNGTSMRLIEE